MEENSPIPISIEGFARLKQELEKLKAERPGVIQAIKEAREEGDLSENAGYHAARERQGMLEAKITFIESRMPRFNVIDMSALGGRRVLFGATVKLLDMDTEQEIEYTLVGPDEADFARLKNCISVFSPVGRALLGKEEGDDVVVNAPRGRLQYEVLEIRFTGRTVDMP